MLGEYEAETSGTGQAKSASHRASPIATAGDPIWAAETFGRAPEETSCSTFRVRADARK